MAAVPGTMRYQKANTALCGSIGIVQCRQHTTVFTSKTVTQ